MSYDIVSDKQSIKLDKEHYLSFLYVGCNNLVDDNGAVVKRWSAVPVAYGRGNRAVPWATIEEMRHDLSNYKKALENEYGSVFANGKGFGQFSTISIAGRKPFTTTFGRYEGLWVGATRKAITVSALRKIAGVSIRLSICPFYAKEHGIDQRTHYPKTGKELMRVYKEFRKRPDGTDGVRVYIELSGADKDMAKDVRRVLFFPKSKAKQSGYVLTYGINGFVNDISSHGVTYTYKKPTLFFDMKREARQMAAVYNGPNNQHGFVVLDYRSAA
jgi:hypothetical protein